jgi:hypothetical protein
MRELKYEVGDDFSISSPNFGDGEVRAVTFSHPNIIVEIYAPAEDITFSLELEKVSSFSFNTDHPQNVIEGIKLFPSRELMRSTQNGIVARLPPTTPRNQGEVVVLIEPIAGSDLACSCERLRIFEQ